MEKVSAMFKLNSGDVVRGLVTAVFAGVIVALAGVVQQPGFDIFTADWATIIRSIINVSVTTFFAYSAKNLITDKEGKILGRI